MVYKGPLPPELIQQIRRDPRQRPIADPVEIEAMITPDIRAQLPLSEAAHRIQALVDDELLGGLGSLALEHDPPRVVLFRKGVLPELVERLIEELRSTVQIEVRDAAYTADELVAEARRIIELDRDQIGVHIWQTGPLNDCSGVRVVIDHLDDLSQPPRGRSQPRSSSPSTSAAKRSSPSHTSIRAPRALSTIGDNQRPRLSGSRNRRRECGRNGVRGLI